MRISSIVRSHFTNTKFSNRSQAQLSSESCRGCVESAHCHRRASTIRCGDAIGTLGGWRDEYLRVSICAPLVKPRQSTDDICGEFFKRHCVAPQIPGDMQPRVRVRVAFATAWERKKKKWRKRENTAREERKLEAHLDKERIARVTLENVCSVSLRSPTRIPESRSLWKAAGETRFRYFVLVSSPRRWLICWALFSGFDRLCNRFRKWSVSRYRFILSSLVACSLVHARGGRLSCIVERAGFWRKFAGPPDAN